MDYVGIFDVPPLWPVFMSAFQSATLFLLLLLGLKLVGRRVFAEQTPQDLVVLVIIAESCGLGLSDARAGYWGTVASVVTILFLGWLCERVGFLRRLIEGKPVLLFRDGRLYRGRLARFMVNVEDLDNAAHENGRASYRDFREIYLEGDGKISCVG